MAAIEANKGLMAAERVVTFWRGEYRRIAQTIGLKDKGVDYPQERLQRIYQEATLQMRWAQIATIEKGFADIVAAIRTRR